VVVLVTNSRNVVAWKRHSMYRLVVNLSLNDSSLGFMTR